MNEGGFDLVTASGDASLRLIAGKRVQPINTALIPSWSTIDERLQNAPWHTVDGVHYGTPYVWGANVLMYNTDVFGDTPPDSWNVVFEETTLPDGKSNKGRVQAYDGPIYVADAALYLMSPSRSWASPTPTRSTKSSTRRRSTCCACSARWSAATGTMRSSRWTTSPTKAWSPPASWPFMVNVLKAGGAPVASVFPKEGITGWADTTMLHADSAHPNCAYMWMEHSLSPKVQGDVSAWFGTVPSVPAACKGNELLTDEGCATNGFDNFDKIQLLAHPDRQVRDGRMRAVLSLGLRLCRRDRRTLTSTGAVRQHRPVPFTGVIPAKAGTHVAARASSELDPCVRRDDTWW